MTKKSKKSKKKDLTTEVGEKMGQTSQRAGEYLGETAEKGGRYIRRGYKKGKKYLRRKMKGRGRGWHDDPNLHALASHGVRTVYSGIKKPRKDKSNRIRFVYENPTDPNDDRIKAIIEYVYGGVKTYPLLDDGQEVPFSQRSFDFGYGPLSNEFMKKYGLRDVSWELTNEYPALKSELESGYETMGVCQDKMGYLWEVLWDEVNHKANIYEVTEYTDWVEESSKEFD